MKVRWLVNENFPAPSVAVMHAPPLNIVLSFDGTIY